MINLSLHQPTRMVARQLEYSHSHILLIGTLGDTQQSTAIFMPASVAVAVADAFTAAMAAHEAAQTETEGVTA